MCDLYKCFYLPTIEDVYLCLARKYSITIVKTTVVLLRVVYIGTFTPRTDSMLTNFEGDAKHKLFKLDTENKKAF